jgi:DNA transformation protein
MASDDFVDYVLELLGPFGSVGARRMFGGHGMYLDGLMFALVSGDALYLKADDMNRIEFQQAGCEAFSYTRNDRRATLNFFRAPEEAMDSAELMLPWARSAYAAALRAQAKKRVAAQLRAAAGPAKINPGRTKRQAQKRPKPPKRKATSSAKQRAGSRRK